MRSLISVHFALYFVWKFPLFAPYFGQKCPLFFPLFLCLGPLLKCGQYAARCIHVPAPAAIFSCACYQIRGLELHKSL